MGRNPFDFDEEPTAPRGTQPWPPSSSPPPGPPRGGPFDFAGPPRAPVGPPRGTRPRRRVRALTAAGVAVAVVAVLIVLVTTLPRAAAPGPVPQAGAPETSTPETSAPASAVAAPPGTGPVTYEIRGTGPAASVSFSAPDGGGDSEVVAPALPFSTTVAPARAPAVFTVVARGGPAPGSLSCRVSRDGRVLDERSADGPGAEVVCSGA